MIAITLLAAALGCAPVFEQLDECPDPFVESSYWFEIEGTVAAVRPDGALELIGVTWDMETIPDRVVPLVNVSLVDDSYLRTLIGKRVEVLITPSFADKPDVPAIVHVGVVDINRKLLAEGHARYIEPPAYTISAYGDCLNRIAEREAREKGLGIWKSTDRTSHTADSRP